MSARELGAVEKTGPRQHLPWVDCAKGIGICLVVLGHLTEGGVHDFIYIFHMPLFFFLSGLLHRVDPSFRSYAKKKALHLLLPYLSFVFLTTLMKTPHFVQRGITAARLEHGLFVVTWGGEAMKGPYGVLWFLTCLFFTQQLANWLLVRFRTSTVVITAAAGLLLSYVNALALPHYSLPLDANVVLASLPFFVAGYLLKRAPLTSGWMLALSSIGAAAAIALLVLGVPLAYDMRGGAYGIPLITPLLALACIVGCLQTSQCAARNVLTNYVFARLGAVSMAIMFLHKELPGVPGYKVVSHLGTSFTFAATLLISYVLAEMISKNGWTRALFLGSSKDLEQLVARFAPRRNGVRSRSRLDADWA